MKYAAQSILSLSLLHELLYMLEKTANEKKEIYIPPLCSWSAYIVQYCSSYCPTMRRKCNTHTQKGWKKLGKRVDGRNSISQQGLDFAIVTTFQVSQKKNFRLEKRKISYWYYDLEFLVNGVCVHWHKKEENFSIVFKKEHRTQLLLLSQMFKYQVSRERERDSICHRSEMW